MTCKRDADTSVPGQPLGYPIMAFSPFVINALDRHHMGGGGNDRTEPIGIYRSGPKIEKFFLDCGVNMHIGTGGRLSATTPPTKPRAAQ